MGRLGTALVLCHSAVSVVCVVLLANCMYTLQ